MGENDLIDRGNLMNWIFILGCNNSGTSLLDYLLGLHPDIDPLKDEGQKVDMHPMPLAYSAPRVSSERLDIFREPVEDVEKLRQVWLDFRASTTGTYTLEKSPPHALASLWLQEHFDPCWFIGIVRNGYYTSKSIYLTTIREISLDRAARHWNKLNKIILEDAKKLDHFIMIKYEDLCADHVAVMRTLEDFLMLDPQHYRNRQGRFRDIREKRYPMPQLHVDLVNKEAKEMLEYYGYLPSN